MEEQLLRQVSRQLRLLNTVILLVGSVVVAGLIVVGYLMYQVVHAVNSARSSVTELRQNTTEKLDPKQVCSDGSTAAKLLRDNTDFCKAN